MIHNSWVIRKEPEITDSDSCTKTDNADLEMIEIRENVRRDIKIVFTVQKIRKIWKFLVYYYVTNITWH